MCKICKRFPALKITFDDLVPEMLRKKKEHVAKHTESKTSSEGGTLQTGPLVSTLSSGPAASEASLNPFPFVKLPPELRNQIYGELLQHGQPINVTMPKAKKGLRPRRFKYNWPGLGGIALLLTCKQISGECQEYLWNHNKLKCDDANTFWYLPEVMGEGFRHARYLVLKMHFKWIVDPDEQWPRAMQLIADEMPELVSFKLWTRFLTGQPPLQETSGDNRIDQEIRALERFGAFLKLRMPEMNFMFMTLPHMHGTYMYISIKLLKDTPKMSKMTERRILLNTRSIRRFSWDDLLQMPPSRFQIDPHSVTSEAGKYDKFLPEDCARIDGMGYMTEHELKAKGHTWEGLTDYPWTDTLITQAQRNAAQRAIEEKERKERKGQAEEGLEALAAHTSLPLPQWGSAANGKQRDRE